MGAGELFLIALISCGFIVSLKTPRAIVTRIIYKNAELQSSTLFS
ncbi:hypothetical protein CARN8_1960002 [mine drainage metagenome]|uniref:Uncharacterized protein n=1 Tax=mine drainage metagenome TaxID=410659 RepID=A0A3P3ZMD6_9ZZZZ